MRRYSLCLLFLLLTGTTCFSQLTETEKELIAPSLSISPDIDFLLELNLHGLSSTGTELPFWLHHNRRGRVSETTKFSTWLTAKSVLFLTENTFLLTGASILFQDGTKEDAVPDELFVHFQNPFIFLTAGRKQRPDLYSGLSATNENILWSLNSQPLPGFQIGTSAPILFFETAGFEFSWNEYFLGKDRNIRDAQLHHKSFHLVYKSEQGLNLKLGAQHFAHYGGERADGSPLPEGSDDYWMAITLKNNLHTHMTTYEAHAEYEWDEFSMELIYNHFSTDRSGRLLENTPDGRYGIFFKRKNFDHLIGAINYEFYYTKKQSKGSESELADNYFNYYQYAEGWMYKQHFIGVPFFTYDPISRRISGNKFIAHHIGIGGQLNMPFDTNTYRFLVTYIRDSGTYPNPINPSQNRFYTFFETGVLKEPVRVDLQFSSETISNSAPVFGLGILLNYRF